MKYPAAYELPTTYEIATLAGIISPQLCADPSTQAQAAKLVLSLMDECAKARREWRIIDKGAARLHEFYELYRLPVAGRVDYRRAAAIVTGDADKKHIERGVQRFEKFMRTLPAEDRELMKSLPDFRKNGIPIEILNYLRQVAEFLGVCAKKVLTGTLNDSIRKRRAKRVTTARRAANSAPKTRKAAQIRN